MELEQSQLEVFELLLSLQSTTRFIFLPKDLLRFVASFCVVRVQCVRVIESAPTLKFECFVPAFQTLWQTLRRWLRLNFTETHLVDWWMSLRAVQLSNVSSFKQQSLEEFVGNHQLESNKKIWYQLSIPLSAIDPQYVHFTTVEYDLQMDVQNTCIQQWGFEMAVSSKNSNIVQGNAFVCHYPNVISNWAVRLFKYVGDDVRPCAKIPGDYTWFRHAHECDERCFGRDYSENADQLGSDCK